MFFLGLASKRTRRPGNGRCLEAVLVAVVYYDVRLVFIEVECDLCGDSDSGLFSEEYFRSKEGVQTTSMFPKRFRRSQHHRDKFF